MVMLFARMLASYSLLGSSFIIVTVPYISMYEIRYATFAWFSLNCPHWLKSNSTPTYRGNVILCRHISEAVYCYFFNGTTRPIIII